MKTCKNCGTPLEDNVIFCPNCGKSIEEPPQTEEYPNETNIQNPFAQTNEQNQQPIDPFASSEKLNQQPYDPFEQQGGFVSQPQMNNYQNNNTVQANDLNTNDEKNTGLNVLSFFIPLVGIICWGVMKKDTPKKAASCGKSALIGIASWFIFSIICTIIATFATFAIVDKAVEYSENGENSYVDEYGNEYDYYYDDTENDNYDFSEETTTALDETTTNKDTVVSNEKINPTTDFTDYVVYYGNEEIKFPCSYSEFSEKTGYTLGSENLSNKLEADKYSWFSLKKGDAYISCTIVNNSSSEKLISDCAIVGITVEEDIFADEPCAEPSGFKFVNDLCIGQKVTLDELREMFGKESYTYDGDDYNTIQFEEEDPEGTISFQSSTFEVIIDDNSVITEISTENFFDI